jgi:hypothetical protein
MVAMLLPVEPMLVLKVALVQRLVAILAAPALVVILVGVVVRPV